MRFQSELGEVLLRLGLVTIGLIFLVYAPAIVIQGIREELRRSQCHNHPGIDFDAKCKPCQRKNVAKVR